MDVNSDSVEYWLPLAEKGDATACYNIGVIFQEQLNIPAATGYYQKAIHLNPMLAEAYNNLGGIYKAKNELDEALNYYLQALKIKPNLPNINNNIGVILQNKKNFIEAMRFFNKTLYLDPSCASAYHNIGLIFEDQKNFLEAASYYEKAYSMDPTLAIAYWSSEMARIQHLCLSQPNSPEAIDKMKALSRWAKDNKVGEKVVGFSHPFYLTYQEVNNRDFFSVYGRECVSIMQHFQKDISRPDVKRTKIRVGIVSDNLHGHSVWYAVLKGWYQHLNKYNFELYSFSLGKKKDAEYELAKKQSDYFIDDIQEVSEWRDVIMAKQPDVLIFPAIGMDWRIHQLACLRMAPVQLTAWGHPETSGMPTMDYYLSADDFEPTHAQENYCETLVRLPHLGSCYEPLALESADFDITDLGVNEDTCLLIAPGKPFKYEKKYDYIFAEIASLSKNAKIVFFKSKPDNLSEEFQKRVEDAFIKKGLSIDEHVIFIPAVRKARFHALMKQAHIYLDTIGFSGFNTAMQGIECGLPIVTFEGRFMRGRFGSAILRRMKLEELVATSIESYIEKAVKLINDKTYRENIKLKIEKMAPTLYADTSVVKSLEEFIASVVH